MTDTLMKRFFAFLLVPVLLAGMACDKQDPSEYTRKEAR